MKKFSLLSTLAVAVLGLVNISNAATSNPVLDDYVAVAEALAKDDLAASKKAAATLSRAAATEKLTTGKAGYYVFTCPMAKAEWVQKTKDVQNPYMGKEMPGCGSIKGGASMGTMKMGGGCG